MPSLSDKTNIDLKTVLWLLAAAVSYGAMYQRVESLREAVAPIPGIERDIAAIKAILTKPNQTALR